MFLGKDTSIVYLDNREVAQGTANLFRGVSTNTINELLNNIPTIANMARVYLNLKERGIVVILASIQWRFLVEQFAREYGFDSYCGTEMKRLNGVLTGEMENYCNAQDKLQYCLDICKSYNIPGADTIAIGDCRSDHPVFRVAGKSIAFNADEDTKNLATYSLETSDLSYILTLLDKLDELI